MGQKSRATGQKNKIGCFINISFYYPNDLT